MQFITFGEFDVNVILHLLKFYRGKVSMGFTQVLACKDEIFLQFLCSFVHWTSKMSQDSVKSSTTAGSASGARTFCSLDGKISYLIFFIQEIFLF